MFRMLIDRLIEHLKALDEQVAQLEAQIKAWHRENDASRKLEKIPGVGPLTATALVASIGEANTFANGRQLAAWLGLVPKQRSSGGKATLLGISKRGDSYLRTLLIHGARAVIRAAARKPAARGSWLHELLKRRNPNVAAVALANKNARIAWALLAHDRQFQAGYAALSLRGKYRPPIAQAIRADGETGKTVVGRARLGRSTSSARFRLGRQPAHSIRDSGDAAPKSECTAAIFAFAPSVTDHAWQSRGVHVRPKADVRARCEKS
jgi:hypothetical protein